MNVDHNNQTTGTIIGAAIAVHRDLGPGLDEATYETALSLKLHSLGIPHVCQVPLSIRYRGTTLDCGYRYDLLVDSRLPVELKAIEAILPIHQAQLLTYLRLGSHPLGLLMNFDVPTLKGGIKRMALSRPPTSGEQCSSDVGVRLDALSVEILAGAFDVHQVLGPGLLRSAYEECLCYELKLRKLPHVRQHIMQIEFEGRILPQPASLPIVVGGSVPVVCLSAGKLTRLHECRLLARLRQTGWPFGFLINFNTPDFQSGVRCIAL